VVEHCHVAVFVAQSHQEVLTGDVVDAVDGTNRYIGKVAVANDFKLGTTSMPCDFTCELTGALNSGELYEVSLMPLDTVEGWSHNFTIDGVLYTGPATIALNQNEPRNITLSVIPGSIPAVASYRLVMKSVTYPGAPEKIADVSVISGISQHW
jgi:hypothetical protein